MALSIDEQNLLKELQAQVDLGSNEAEVKESLLKLAWKKKDVEKALELLSSPLELVEKHARASVPEARAILKQAWAIFTRKGFTLGIIVFLSSLPIALLAILSSSTSSLSQIENNIISSFLNFIIWFLSLMLHSLGVLATVYALKEQNISAIIAYKKAFNKVLISCWINIITGIAIGIGFIFCIIPGVFLSLHYIFVSSVLVFENKSWWQVLATSGKYSSKKKVKVLSRVLTCFMLNAIIVLFMIFIFCIGICSFAPDFLHSPLFPVVGISLLGVLALLFCPVLFWIYLVVLYQRLRILKQIELLAKKIQSS